MAKCAWPRIIATIPPFRVPAIVRMICISPASLNIATPPMCTFRATPPLKSLNSFIISHTCTLSADNGQLILIMILNII